jgi:hypothetical protein
MKARRATLVVIEFGASWPRWLDPAQSRAGDMAVVAQHYEGLPSDLITQVASRVTRLEAMGWQLSAVVLVSNGRADGDTSAARSVLARGLLARLAAAGGGHFALSVEERLGKRARHSLSALATALEPAARAGEVSLHVRVGAAEIALESASRPGRLQRAS